MWALSMRILLIIRPIDASSFNQDIGDGTIPFRCFIQTMGHLLSMIGASSFNNQDSERTGIQACLLMLLPLQVSAVGTSSMFKNVQSRYWSMGHLFKSNEWRSCGIFNRDISDWKHL